MQDAHNDYDITDFHGALLDIISVMNQPLRDEQILQAAGVQLEQMLFPLLVAVGRHGPVAAAMLLRRSSFIRSSLPEEVILQSVMASSLKVMVTVTVL